MIELLAPLAVGLAAYLTRALDATSSVAGTIMAYMVIFSRGFDWFLLLITFFAASMAVTKYKYAKKEKIGLSQKRRTIENVLGNGIAPLIFALWGNQFSYVAALAAATSDTFSSEIGVLSKTPPVSVLDFRTHVKAGSNGGVSTLGNMAMFIGSAVIAVTSLVLFNNWGVFWVALWCGVFGSVFDSIIGATIENKGTIGNAVTNFMASFTAGLVALAISTLI